MRANITATAIAQKIIVPEDCPKIILGIGPCRSATTPSLRVFAQQGIPSFYQPIKGIIRSMHAGTEVVPFDKIPSRSTGVDTIYIKDALGPFTPEESTFNPLEVLLNAGVPRDKLHVVTFFRNPLTTVNSWLEHFSIRPDISRKTLIQNAITATETVAGITQKAQAEGIPTTTFVYESLIGNDPMTVQSRLFTNLGLPFDPDLVTNWRDLPQPGTPESLIWRPGRNPTSWGPENSPAYQGLPDTGVHRDFLEAEGFRYIPHLLTNITEADIRAIAASGIYDLYNLARRASSWELNLPILEATELMDYALHRENGMRRETAPLFARKEG